MVIKAYKAIITTGKIDLAQKYFLETERAIKEKYLNTGKIMNVHVFGKERELYIYIESCCKEILPKDLFLGSEEFLVPWPDGEEKYFSQITEIFHFNEPQSVEHWKRKHKGGTTFGSVAKIKRELASRYIYYHYQFQEENPGAGDKYGRIFLYDDIAFYYGEEPMYREEPLHKGALSTKNTPQGEEWQNIMGEHFIWWDKTLENIKPDLYDWENAPYPEGCTNNQWLYLKKYLSVM